MEMARYVGAVMASRPQEEAWSYLADLRSVAEWDPSVGRVELVSGDPGTVGARYELDVTFGGQSITLPYVTVEAEPPQLVVFEAQTDSVEIRDEARIAAMGPAACEVTWDADLQLRGWRRAFDLPLRIAFHRLGSRAQTGLAEHLNEAEVGASNGRVHA
jgi:carbon monoxide dehydrogenase subunit G